MNAEMEVQPMCKYPLRSRFLPHEKKLFDSIDWNNLEIDVEEQKVQLIGLIKRIREYDDFIYKMDIKYDYHAMLDTENCITIALCPIMKGLHYKFIGPKQLDGENDEDWDRRYAEDNQDHMIYDEDHYFSLSSKNRKAYLEKVTMVMLNKLEHMIDWTHTNIRENYKGMEGLQEALREFSKHSHVKFIECSVEYDVPDHVRVCICGYANAGCFFDPVKHNIEPEPYMRRETPLRPGLLPHEDRLLRIFPIVLPVKESGVDEALIINLMNRIREADDFVKKFEGEYHYITIPDKKSGTHFAVPIMGFKYKDSRWYLNVFGKPHNQLTNEERDIWNMMKNIYGNDDKKHLTFNEVHYHSLSHRKRRQYRKEELGAIIDKIVEVFQVITSKLSWNDGKFAVNTHWLKEYSKSTVVKLFLNINKDFVPLSVINYGDDELRFRY